jgi:CDP-glycerol glycerophosphotransferase
MGRHLIKGLASLAILVLLGLLLPFIMVVRVAARFAPRKKNLILLIPRFGGAMNGNMKYLFLYLVQRHHGKDCEVFLISHHRAAARRLREQGLPVLFHPSFRSIVALLRAGAVVVEATDWWHRAKSLLAMHAKSFQIWHGNGMKNISLTNKNISGRLQGSVALRWAIHWLNVYPVYDYVCFASDLQLQRRGPSFRMRNALINGQPRNDVLFGVDFGPGVTAGEGAAVDRVRSAAALGKRVVLYSPTWRPERDLQPAQALDLDELNAFALRHDLIIAWKAHPKDKCPVADREAIVVIDKMADAYPLMQHVDCMVTDYSSIFMDYILLDRPVVFFPYDRDSYVNERGLQHDYDEVSPGPKCNNQLELQQTLKEILIDGRDSWAAQRAQVRRDFYKYQDGRSCERLYEAIRECNGF